MIHFLRQHVFHNFLLKFVSLAFAVLLWAAVARDPVAEVAVTVPIEFQHPGNLEVISGERIPEAQILVRGPGRLVRGLTRTDVQPVIDLAGARPGEHTYDLAPPRVHTPHGIEVVQVMPAQLHLRLEVRAEKDVPVRPRVIGRQPASITTSPASVRIAGPAERVEGIAYAISDPVDVTGVGGTVTFPGVPVYVPDPLVQVVRPTSVTVTLDLPERR
jgi:YbbR domain-containing protein